VHFYFHLFGGVVYHLFDLDFSFVVGFNDGVHQVGGGGTKRNVFDDEGLKIGGDVLDSTDPRLVEFERVAERLLDKLRDTGKDYNAVQKEARTVAEQRQATALIESGNVQTLGSDGKISVTRGRGRNAKTVKQEPKKGTIYKLPSGRFGRYMGDGKFESVE